MAEYRDSYGEFLGAGIDVAAISTDTPLKAATVARELRLLFTLLCDPGREMLARWNLLNRDEKGGIAFPASFLIDRDRKVRFRCLEEVGCRVSARDMARYARAIVGGAPIAVPEPIKVRPGMLFLRAVINSIRLGVQSPSDE